MQEFFTSLGAILGFVTSAVSLWAGLTGKGPGSQGFWILIAYVSLAFAFFMLWLKEHRAAKIGKAFWGSLKGRYNDIALEWTQLDTIYQAWAKQQQYVPPNLPEPMSSSHWGLGDIQFRFRVGVLQAKTNGLVGDLIRVGNDIGYAKAAPHIRSVPELLAVLQRCKL